MHQLIFIYNKIITRKYVHAKKFLLLCRMNKYAVISTKNKLSLSVHSNNRNKYVIYKKKFSLSVHTVIIKINMMSFIQQNKLRQFTQ